MKMRTARCIRESRQTTLIDQPGDEPSANVVWRELRTIFDEELASLPANLRLPAILCFLEGLSKGEAARTLGWPKARLGSIATSPRTIAKSVSPSWHHAFFGNFRDRAWRAWSIGIGPGKSVRDHVENHGDRSIGRCWSATLADGVLRTMFVAKMKAMAATVLMVGAIGTGLDSSGHQATATAR